MLVLAALFAAPAAQATNYRVSIGPTMGLLNLGSFSSQLGWGGTLQAGLKPMASTPLRLHLESGFVTWADRGIRVSNIPLMVGATYDLTEGQVATPYIGVSAGIGIVSTNITALGNEIYFNGLLKPGIEFYNVFIEPKFGLLKDEFIFLPTVGYNINF